MPEPTPEPTAPEAVEPTTSTPTEATEPTAPPQAQEPTETTEPTTDNSEESPDFGWGDEESEENAPPLPEPEEGYVVDFGELPISDDIKTEVTALGKTHSVDAKTLGRLTQDLDNLVCQKQQQFFNEEGARLKQEWGAAYDANHKIASASMRKFAKENNIPLDTMRQQLPPTVGNMKLLLKLNQLEAGTSQVRGEAKKEQTWFGDVNSELFKAWGDPSNPRHNEARALRAKSYK